MENKNDQLLSLIFNLSRFIRKELFMGECLANISHSEAEVLLFLRESKKTTMRAVADYLKIEPSSVTPVVDRLLKKGMLHRAADKKDRRVVYVELTKKGLKKLSDEKKKIHSKMKNIFGSLSEKNKRELIKIVETILKNHEQKK